MKKRNTIAIVLIIALLMMGSAYALWTDQVVITVSADSATLDVRITERTVVGVTPAPGSSTSISQVAAVTITAPGQKSVTESITKFLPEEVVTINYRIANLGDIDVDLSGITVTFPGSETQTLPTIVNWTVSRYQDGSIVAGTTNSGTGSTAVFANAIELLDSDNDYCLLTLAIAIDDASAPGPYASMLESTFTITPAFSQK